MSFVRPSKEYSFYGQTMSLCEVCLNLIHAKITIEGDNVFHLKRCREHGAQKTLISTAGGNPPDIAGTWGAQIEIGRAHV